MKNLGLNIRIKYDILLSIKQGDEMSTKRKRYSCALNRPGLLRHFVSRKDAAAQRLSTIKRRSVNDEW